MMPDEEDYYGTLGIPADASAQQVKEAYTYLAYVHHPDRQAGAPERIRQKSEELMKRLNIAYEVLSNPEKRRIYDANRKASGRWPAPETGHTPTRASTRPARPRPEIHPDSIRFDKAVPYVTQSAVFFVRNTGGPYTKVLVGATPDWLRIVETAPLQQGDKMPMRVRIEAVGNQWGTTRSATVRVRLDDAEAGVSVELRTVSLRGGGQAESRSSSGADAAAGSAYTARPQKAQDSTGRRINLFVLTSGAVVVLAVVIAFAVSGSCG